MHQPQMPVLPTAVIRFRELTLRRCAGGQGALPGTNSGADASAAAATQPLLLPAKLQLSGGPPSYVRRTPEELAKQYQEFMGEPI